MWIATAPWLIAALTAVIDRDTLNAVAWFGFVAGRGPERERCRGTLQGAGSRVHSALLVAGVAILMGVFGVRARRGGASRNAVWSYTGMILKGLVALMSAFSEARTDDLFIRVRGRGF
jgi:hypothetical protein